MKNSKKIEAELITRKQAYEEVIPVLDIFENHIREGAKLAYNDPVGGNFRLVDKKGDYICSGKTVREMLINLIFTEC